MKRRVTFTVAVVALAAIGFLAPNSQAATVVLPAGSVDGLAGAIAAAGPGGIVLVETGMHYESDTVLVDIPVTILGEPGAVIISDTTAAFAPAPIAIDPALWIKDTSNVTVQGLELRPLANSDGSCAVLIEDSPHVVIANNTITGDLDGGYQHGYQFGVIVQRGDHAEISSSKITINSGWKFGTYGHAQLHGVVVINGEHVRIRDNHISNAALGIWACHVKGRIDGNTLTVSYYGLLLCRVGDGLFRLPSGDTQGALTAATGWHVHDNTATWNLADGYLVSDGSNNNKFANNAASNNGLFDLEFLGDNDCRFQTPRPVTYDNVVAVGRYKDLVINDCGEENRVNDDVMHVCPVFPCGP